MAKPILIARLTKTHIALSNDYASEVNKRLSKKLKDYHVLVVVDKRSKGDIKFECFNTNDIETVDLDYLKWYVTKQTR